MNKNTTRCRCNYRVVPLIALALAAAIAGPTGCKDPTAPSAHNRATTTTAPAAKDVVGLSEAELRAKYPQVTALDRSFELLVSKSLRPYRVPAEHKLLRFGRDYLVAELKDGRVIALHPVSG